MHEASLMKDLMGKIETLGEAENARRVIMVRVWLGALSHMSPEHFREHFAHSSSGTLAEGAALEFEVSGDISDPNAQALILQSIEVEGSD